MIDIELRVNEFLYSYRQVADIDGFEWEQINSSEEFIYAISCYALECQYAMRSTDKEKETFCSDDFNKQVIAYLNSKVWESRVKIGDVEYYRIKTYREPMNLDILIGKGQYARLYYQFEVDEEKCHFVYIYIRCLYYYLAFRVSNNSEEVVKKLKKILSTETIDDLCKNMYDVICCWNKEEMQEYLNALDELQRVNEFIKNHCIEDKHSFRFNN